MAPFNEVCLNDMNATRAVNTREAGFAISYYAPSTQIIASSYRGWWHDLVGSSCFPLTL